MRNFFVTDRSFLGRCHPVTRVIVFGIACVPPMLTTDAVTMAVLTLVFGIALAATGGASNLWRARRVIVMICLMSVVLWSVLLRRGIETWNLGPLSVHRESALFGAAMALRLLSFFLAALAFLAATSSEELSYALSRLGLPYRASFALSLAFRLTPLFLDTAAQVAAAQRARGLDLDGGGLMTRARRHLAILTPVLLISLRRADGMAVALEAKGFGATGHPSCVLEYRVTWRDVFWPAFALVIVAVVWSGRLASAG